MSLDTGRRFRPRSRSPSQAHNEVIGAPPATRLARNLTRAESAICLDPPPGGPAEPITLRDKLAYVWKQLLAAPPQISVAVDLRSITK